MSYYSNPTANAAIGAIDQKIKKLEKRAKYLAKCKKLGRLTPEMEAAARRQYTGIFRPILERALNPKEKTSPEKSGDVAFYFFTAPCSSCSSSDAFIDTEVFSVVNSAR